MSSQGLEGGFRLQDKRQSCGNLNNEHPLYPPLLIQSVVQSYFINLFKSILVFSKSSQLKMGIS